jgi:hypothetical protein
MGQTDSYVPGTCNIGPEEIRARRRFGHASLVAMLLAAALLFHVGAAPVWRLLLFFPAMAGASGYLQASMKFCVGFGFRAAYNFGAVGGGTPVQDAEARKKDRQKSKSMTLAAALIGAAVALAAWLLP